MKCKTCSHPQRQAIDQALLEGNHTFETLSHIYGLSISSLFRHKKHLKGNMRQARQSLRDTQDLASLLKLNTFLDQVQRAVQAAEANGDIDRVLRGSQVGSRIIHQINQMEVPLELATVHRLITSPQWVSQDSLFPTDPKIITGIHQALVDAALFPCPDTPPVPAAADPDDEDDDLDDDDDADDWEDEETFPADSEPETQAGLETKILELAQKLLVGLNHNDALAPKSEREKSANFLLKTPLSNKKIYQFQTYIPWGKSLAKNPFPAPFSPVPDPGPQTLAIPCPPLPWQL